MKSNLARIHQQHPLAGIEEAANRVLERENEEPAVTKVALKSVAKSASVTIGGFVLHDQDAEDTALADARRHRRNTIKVFHQDRDMAAEMLQAREIKALAIVPKTAWGTLSEKSKLFRICPNSEGMVRVEGGEILTSFKNRARPILMTIYWLLIASITSIATWIVGSTTSWNMRTGAIEMTTLLSCVASFLIIGFVLYEDRNRRDNFCNKLVQLQIWLFSLMPRASLLRHLLPNGVSPSSNGSSRDLYAKVILPQPPADVVAVLLKAKGLELHVAAEAGAIAFAESYGDILHREHSKIMDEEAQQRERERQARLDPIIYIEVGTAVAIIAQFGEFPIEQAVVNQVMNSEFLL